MFAKLQSRLIFLSLFIASTAFSMENSIGGDKSEKKSIPRKVVYMSSDYQSGKDKHESILDQFIGDIKKFDEDDIANMTQMFNNAPKEAQNIVKHLKNRNFLCDGAYRSTIFYGIPGSGKTTISSAIAYKMAIEAGWKYALISSTDFLKEYRNQTAIYLNHLFDDIISRDEPFILIIDELNQLLENADSKHHDCDATSKVIWSFLDSRKNKHNFFFIGTMNRINKLPQPFKSRILFRCIEFGPLTNPTQKNELFRKKLLCNFVRLDQGITDDVLNVELQKINNCTGRDLEEFASALKRAFRNHDDQSEIMVIGKVHVDEVINRYLKTYSFAQYDKKEETDEERSERHHQENITNQNTNHRESINSQNTHHRENIENQNTNHRETITNQNTHYQGNLDNQNTNHRETIANQNTHHQENITNQNINHRESINTQNAHYQGNLDNQNINHQENLRIQAENRIMQEGHFTTQQERQTREHVEIIFKNFVQSLDWAYMSAEINANYFIDDLLNLQTINALLSNNSPIPQVRKRQLMQICSYFSDDQIRIFESMMVNMLRQRTNLIRGHA